MATEPPKQELLQRPPHGRFEYIINQKMVKHILLMAVWQCVVIFVILFAGDSFIPEKDGYEPRNGDFVHTGRLYDFDGSELYKEFKDDEGFSRHYTVLFNVFVLLQIFCMVSARKINDEKNIFEGLHMNPTFIGIWLLIFVIQVIITQLSQDVFQVCRDGLTGAQWGICIAFAATVWPVNLLIKYVPDRFFCKVSP